MSVRGNTCAQLFVSDNGHAKIYPMSSKGQAFDKLDSYCSTIGIPKFMVSDNAGEETGGEWDCVRKNTYSNKGQQNHIPHGKILLNGKSKNWSDTFFALCTDPAVLSDSGIMEWNVHLKLEKECPALWVKIELPLNPWQERPLTYQSTSTLISMDGLNTMMWKAAAQKMILAVS